MALPVSATHTNGFLAPPGNRTEAPDGLRRRTAEAGARALQDGAAARLSDGVNEGREYKSLTCSEAIGVLVVASMFAVTMTGLLCLIATRIPFK